MPWHGVSIRRLLALLAALVVLPLGIDFFYETILEVDEGYKEANERAMQLARTAASDAERFLKQTDFAMAVLARRPLVQALDPKNCDSMMLELPTLSQRYEVPSTMDLNGRFICHSRPLSRQPADPGPEIRDRLAQMQAAPGFLIGRLKQGVLTGSWIVPLSRPIFGRDGKLKGMINLTVDLKRFSTLVAGGPLPTDYSLALVDGDGQVLTGSGGMENHLGRNHQGNALRPLLKAHREAVIRTQGLDGVERLFAVVPVAGSDWMVMAGIPAASIDRQARETRNVHLLVGLLLFVMVGGSTWLLYRRIERPLSRLLKATRAIAEGKTYIRVEPSSVREFSELGDGFNSMLDALDRQQGEMEEARLQLEKILSAVEEVIYSWSPRDGTVYFVSAAFERLYGMSLDELNGDPVRWTKVLHPDDQGRVSAALSAISEKGESYDMEYRIELPDRGVSWVHDRARATLDKEGRVQRVDGLAIDITGRKMAERTVRESESRLAGIVATATDGILMVDEDHRITLFNPAAERMFGVSAREIIGQPLGRLLPEDARERHTRHMREVGHGDIPHRRLQEPGRVRGRRSNGEIFPLDASISRMQLGGRRYFTALLRDRTDQERQEQAIRELNEQLERRVAERTSELQRAMKELESFSYSISHDLRAPLRAINGFANILRETENFSEDGKDLLSRVMRNSEKMGELIDDVLAFSRITRAELAPTDVNMETLAASVAGELNDARTTVQIFALPPCRGDAAMLRQVWANLIGNAIKFSSERTAPLVEIGALLSPNEDREETLYFVRDNGAGFDMQYANRLFGVFQRMHAAERFPGTGVGLAIVKQIVERHQGRVWAESSLDHGACFYFTIGRMADEGDGTR